MLPEVVYPKKYIEELYSEIEKVREKISQGEQQAFENADALLADLEKEI